MSFAQQLRQFDWDDTRMSIYARQASDVRRALTKDRLDLQDMQALLSPAAEPYLEQMALRAYQLTRQRFGNTVQMYVPLYLSNLCSNICSYCGFSMHNPVRRKTLDEHELQQEIDAIKQMGFDHILLVTGESERKVGMPYFRKVLPLLRPHFSHISMEVQPLDTHEYRELIQLGVDAVLVYQETYHRRSYAKHHLKGKKRDFDWRLATPERLGEAGINKIGLGSLIGLEDWRTDALHVAAHLQYLEKAYWKTRYSLSFPRLRPCAGQADPVSLISDKQLVQLICAYRLFNPEVELSLSTRESAALRDNLFPLGITSISAASQTQPGGYADTSEQALQQFEIDDQRDPQRVAVALRDAGLQAVWKDWEAGFR